MCPAQGDRNGISTGMSSKCFPVFGALPPKSPHLAFRRPCQVGGVLLTSDMRVPMLCSGRARSWPQAGGRTPTCLRPLCCPPRGRTSMTQRPWVRLAPSGWGPVCPSRGSVPVTAGTWSSGAHADHQRPAFNVFSDLFYE